MKRKLFCEISPLTYCISLQKEIMLRHLRDCFSRTHFAKTKSDQLLPVVVYKHNSLIRRKLGNVDMRLQENKAVNLGLAAPKVNLTLIQPGETFSFWKLVGNVSAKKGYLDGVTISSGEAGHGVGGGLCQFTNLIHWMILHTPLQITEHHHHDGVDLFPDFNRQIPFGTGTSILYNFLDYRFQNTTDLPFQLVVYTTDEYLCGEIRSSAHLPVKYHIEAQNERFVSEGGEVYRLGEVYRSCIDVRTGNVIARELIRQNHAKVVYDTTNLTLSEV